MTHFELLKYAATGIASPGMTAYDKMRALAMGGGKVKTLTGVPPLSFRANGKPLISWSMLGNGEQTGTPSPDNIIMPEFCGKLVGTDWIIPITNAGQTQNVYLGEVPTVRKIRKIEFDGSENWILHSVNDYGIANYYLVVSQDKDGVFPLHQNVVSTHFAYQNSRIANTRTDGIYVNGQRNIFVRINSTAAPTLTAFKTWLADQYSAGTPVTVWYVLATPETAIVNEPLAKIGDYADELHSADAGASIPTARGQNKLTVDTDLQPSSMTITYR